MFHTEFTVPYLCEIFFFGGGGGVYIAISSTVYVHQQEIHTVYVLRSYKLRAFNYACRVIYRDRPCRSAGANCPASNKHVPYQLKGNFIPNA